MVAWPVSYGQTGVMSFVINQDDKVYQADLGNDSEQKARALTTYNPDKTWQPVAPESSTKKAATGRFFV